MKKELGIFVLLIVLCIIVSAVNPNFLLPINLQNLARQIGAFGIFSIGLGLVIITGGIELSVGSMMALLGVLLSMMLTEWNFGVAIAVLACIGLAMVLSLGGSATIARSAGQAAASISRFCRALGVRTGTAKSADMRASNSATAAA